MFFCSLSNLPCFIPSGSIGSCSYLSLQKYNFFYMKDANMKKIMLLFLRVIGSLTEP